MKTYKEAIKPPKDGYKYSDNTQTIAQLSEMIGAKHCLRPNVIYEWAIKHNIKLIEYMPMLMSNDSLLLASSALFEDIMDDKFQAVQSLNS